MIQDISVSECNPQLESDQVNINKTASPEVRQPEVEVSSHKLEIVHATNGRVRIRAAGGFHSQLETISQKLQHYKGVTKVCLHQQTSSLVITFDQTLLSMAQMLDILQQLNVEPIPVSKVDILPGWKSLDFWQEQSISLIPLITGLAVTGGLGITGLAAIPVYMITATATRRVISDLEPKSGGSHVQPSRQTAEFTSHSCSVHSTVAYGIVHVIPGRIRFHVPRLAQDGGYGRRLERLLKADPHVVRVRVNDHAASITITHQPDEVRVSHWVSLMELAGETNPSTRSNGTTPENSPSIWADMKYPGLCVSLDYMAKLSL